MVGPTSAAARVSDALQGAPGTLRGISFVSEEVLAEIVWNNPSDSPVVSAVRDLALDFAFVRAHDPRATRLTEQLAEAGAAALWVVDGPFGQVAAERGWAAALADVIRARDQLATDLSAVAQRDFEHVRAAAQAGAAAIVVAEDLSLASGFLMGPDDALELLIPALGTLAREAHAHGLAAVLHSDGDVRAFMAALARQGFAGLHLGGLGWEGFEAQYQAARAHGLAVLGGLEGAELRQGSAVAARVGARVAVLAEKGGLLVCDDGGLTRGEEVAALVTALQAVPR